MIYTAEQWRARATRERPHIGVQWYCCPLHVSHGVCDDVRQLSDEEYMQEAIRGHGLEAIAHRLHLVPDGALREKGIPD